jgi:hypothetical protein
MNGQERGKLIDVITRFYNLAQLNAIVQKALNQPLEYFANGGTYPVLVDKLLADLELRPDDRDTFLAVLKVATTRSEVRGAINAYYGVPPDPDPYDSLRPLDEPFVNRQNSREKLRSLFRSPNRRALVIRGPKASGKSHSHWLIEYVARSEGIEPVLVQLRGATLDDVVTQIINDLQLPVQEFRDRQAQASTQTKGFISAFRGWTKTLPPLTRWCLLFDNHDDESVDAAVSGFVDALLSEVADFTMPPVFVIVLGHRTIPRPGAATAKRAVTDDILQMTQPDVERFLQQLATQNGAALQPGESTTLAASVFENLVSPLDHDGMTTLSGRLADKITAMGVI